MVEKQQATATRPYDRPTTAIITDAGKATRFLPWTKNTPKAMAPIWDKPIMQLVVEECATAGIENIIIVTTKDGEGIYEDYFNDNINPVRQQLKAQGKYDRYAEVDHVLNLPITHIITQNPALPYGNGSPIISAKDYIPKGEAFIVCYSDDIVLGSSDVATLLKSFDRHPDADAIIMAQDVDRSEVDKYGIVSLKDGDLLDNIVEKPKVSEAPSTLASYGRYLLTPQIFNYLKPNATGKDGELWTVDGITKIAESGKVYVERTKGQWLTTGDPQNYFMAQLEYVLGNGGEFAKAVRGFVNNH